MIRTTPTLFIDSNIPLYASGPPHDLKEPSSRVLVLMDQQPAHFVTSAEVLQEVLHLSLRRRDPGVRLFHAFNIAMAGRVEAVYPEDVEAAADIVGNQPGLEARDGVHLAVMRRLGVRHMVSADARLSRINGVERLDPRDIGTWLATIFP